MVNQINPIVNATNGALDVTTSISGLSGASSWFSVVIIVILATVCMLLFTIALSNIQRYRKIRGVLKWFVTTIQYFFFGLGGLGMLAVPIVIIIYFINQANQGNTVPIEFTISIIIGYFVIAGLGYIFKHFVFDKFKLFEQEISKEKQKSKKKKTKKEK